MNASMIFGSFANDKQSQILRKYSRYKVLARISSILRKKSDNGPSSEFRERIPTRFKPIIFSIGRISTTADYEARRSKRYCETHSWPRSLKDLEEIARESDRALIFSTVRDNDVLMDRPSADFTLDFIPHAKATTCWRGYVPRRLYS